MENYDLKKGLLYGIICAFLISFQPIISNLRPDIIDAYSFSTFTAVFIALFFFPLFIIERYKLKSLMKKEVSNRAISIMNGWKKKRNVKLFILIGITFSIVPLLLIIGFDLAGAINSSIALKAEVLFALLFGYIFLKEKKISKIQFLFCITLFLGLLIAITQGFADLPEFNIGVFIILFTVVIFTLVHTFTKSGFDRNEITPIQVIFIRNLLSGGILLSIYFIFLPLEVLITLLNPEYLIYPLALGVDWGLSLFFWYKTLLYIEIGKAGVINSITPIITAFFSFILLGEIFTIAHLVGVMIVIISIYMIVREKKDKKEIMSE